MIFEFVLIFRHKNQEKTLPGLQRELTGIPLFDELNPESVFREGDSYKFLGFVRDDNKVNCIADHTDYLVVLVGNCITRTDARHFCGYVKEVSAEQILSLFREYHSEFIHWFKGNFKILILDKLKNILHVFNDRSGILPLYYSNQPNFLIFTSSIFLVPQRYRGNAGLDSNSLLEYALFNFPLSRHTLVKDFEAMLPAEIIQVVGGELSRRNYFSFQELLRKTYQDPIYSLDDCIEKFHEVLNDRINPSSSYCLSFTGGFDSRVNRALLNLRQENLLLYAFGAKNSPNISIPKKISKKFGWNFKAFYLEDDYLVKYPYFARMTCLTTDGLATVQRANYSYIFRELANFSTEVITGIFGSELLRTFQNAGVMISNLALRVIQDEHPVEILEREIKDYPSKLLWGDSVFNEATVNTLLNTFSALYRSDSFENRNHFIYSFFISEAVRKYFSGEVKAENFFCNNIFPFFDDEFLEILVQSEHTSFQAKIQRPTYSDKFTSQYLYALAIKKHKPDLLDFRTDHGYSPAALLSSIPSLLIGPRYIFNIARKKINKEFYSEAWFNALLGSNPDFYNNPSILNTQMIKLASMKGHLRKSLNEQRKLFSIHLFYNYLTNSVIL